MSDSDALDLHAGMLASGMDYGELWLRYVEVGGSTGPVELEACVLGLMQPDDHQHDIIAHALNEWFTEHGQDHPVAYRFQLPFDPE